MKNLILILLVVALLFVSLAQLVAASEVPISLYSINMTATNTSLLTIGMAGMNTSQLLVNTSNVIIELTGVHVYPISCDFGLLRPGDVKYTGLAFEILNATNTTLDVSIAVRGDWAGSTNWTHSDDCIPGVDTAGMVAIVQGSTSLTAVIVRKSDPYNDIVTGLDPDQTLSFGLQLYAPTSFTEYSTKTNAIFVTTGGS